MCSVADVRPVIGMANALVTASTVKQSETAKAAAAILP